ncbi:hypothetical protein NM688_g7783 [Phlebia brevispora]|uniref:Uncharacterized protein n=1 Tax=Phlebia brevispora TaxID=194682 RepID=A0ACC1S180_9APHY|nr:hypothetical protein NM688_g7783 [Phlebia brevispora]
MIAGRVMGAAKSGNEWTQNNLLLHNVEVVYQDAATFFESPELPSPTVHNEILTAENVDAVHHDDAYMFLRMLELAMSLAAGEDSAVADFVVNLFRLLGYTGRGRVARTRKSLPFFNCGENRQAYTDVCILNDISDVLLVVQEDKRHLGGYDPEPQLIAEAIAAFCSINLTRVRAIGIAPLQRKVISGIIMCGTMPTFYKIPVTGGLVEGVQRGVGPFSATIVYAHLPDLPRPVRRYMEGMKPLDNRQRIFSCYEALRRFL